MVAHTSVDDVSAIAEALGTGCVRTASRLISRAEANDSTIGPILKQLFRRACDTPIIGITGPPGAGKSTLVNQLISGYRARDQRVAVLAVDPSSPFSGGAILGDRVRMNQHASDSDVFIRSMAARGQLGGLAKASADALTILQAMNFDKIILETVGVGQSEVDIIRHASTVLVLQIPGTGDSVQSVKAGILEIGDIYVVNKADLPGAEKLAAALEETLLLSTDHGAWQPPVLCVEASNGVGIEPLTEVIENHDKALRNKRDDNAKAELRARHRVAEICQQRIKESVFSEHVLSQAQIQAIVERRQDPYSLADELLRRPELN